MKLPNEMICLICFFFVKNCDRKIGGACIFRLEVAMSIRFFVR